MVKVKKIKTKTVKTKKVSMKAVSKMVDKKLDARIENKKVQQQSSFTVLPSSAAAASIDATIVQLSPNTATLQLTQGTGQAGRTGNQVEIKKGTLKLYLTPRGYDATVNTIPRPSVVQVVIFYDKSKPSDDPTPAQDANFYEFNNSVAGFAGDISDIIDKINKDRYQVFLRKTYKIGYAANTGDGSNAGFAYYTNNDFKLNHYANIDITKHLIKKIKFQDNSAFANTRGLYMLAYCVPAVGTDYASNQLPINLWYSIQLEYEDA